MPPPPLSDDAFRHPGSVAPVLAGDVMTLPFPIAGLGAPVGGLKALLAFVEALPEGIEMAFVVARHVAPGSEEDLADLLPTRSFMTVVQVEEGATSVEAGHVYVVPPGTYLRIEDGMLVVAGPADTREPGAPPDVRFLDADPHATDVRCEREALAALNARLEERVQERTEQVRALALALSDAEQQERTRIAQVLHDDLQQVLYGLRLKLDALREDLAAPTRNEEDVARNLARSNALIARALAVTRTLTFDLKPPVLADENLDASLAWLAEHMRRTHDLDVRLHLDAPVPIHDAALHTLLVQLVRELLFNVVKHAATDRTDVYAHLNDGLLLLTVHDEGNGFDPALLERERPHGQSGFGLLSIRERLALYGGRMDVVSGPASGTRITLSLPIRPLSSEPLAAST